MAISCYVNIKAPILIVLSCTVHNQLAKNMHLVFVDDVLQSERQWKDYCLHSHFRVLAFARCTWDMNDTHFAMAW